MKRKVNILTLIFLFLVCAFTMFGTPPESATAQSVNQLWVVVGAALVFFMQLGFLFLEVGLVQPKTVLSVAAKNVLDVMVVTLAFYLVGFGFMFGTSFEGFIGTDLFLLKDYAKQDSLGLGYIFFLFQLGFVAAAATIVSGAMAGRTGFPTYLLIAVTIAVVIYPFMGHMVWGNAMVGENETFLTKLGFIDFAGGTVVHLLGAVISFIGTMMLGPRLGRFDSKGKPRELESSKFAFGWAASGVIVLWFGWWGFNGASTLEFSDTVNTVLINTNLSAVAAGLTAFLHSWFIQDKNALLEKFLGGILGGLVVITPCAHILTPNMAIVAGLLGGVIHNIGYDLVLYKWKIDDPVGAIPVHGFCGAFGTLCVAFFGDISAFGDNTRLEQLGVQLIGIMTCIVWVSITAYLMFFTLRKTIGLRVSPDEEKAGINISLDESDFLSDEDDDDEELSEDELKDLLG